MISDKIEDHFVYVIECNQEPTSYGAYKIGVGSGDVKKRLKSLQTGCPFELTLVNKFDVETSRQAYKLERLFRLEFSDSIIRNEWHDCDTREVINFLSRGSEWR